MKTVDEVPKKRIVHKEQEQEQEQEDEWKLEIPWRDLKMIIYLYFTGLEFCHQVGKRCDGDGFYNNPWGDFTDEDCAV